MVETPAGCPSSLFPLNLAVFGQSCFQFNFEKSDWEVARNRCLSDGGDLIQIRTEPLQRFLERLLELQKTEKTGFWIGATDKDIESKWEWATGSFNKVVMQFTLAQNSNIRVFLISTLVLLNFYNYKVK